MSSKINFEKVGGSHTVVTHSFDHCSLTAMQNKQGETMNKKKKGNRDKALCLLLFYFRVATNSLRGLLKSGNWQPNLGS